MPAELWCQAQSSVRECIASADVQRRAGWSWVVPLAASAAVAAAPCVPVAWPALVAASAGSGVAALVGIAFSQVNGVGGNLVAEAVIRAWGRVRARRLAGAGQADLRDALAAELAAGLAQGAVSAAALREEMAGVLRDSHRWMLSGHAVMKEQPPGSPAVALTGQTLLLVGSLECCGADLNVLGHTFGAVLPSPLSAPATPGGKEGQRAADGFWRCDGR